VSAQSEAIKRMHPEQRDSLLRWSRAALSGRTVGGRDPARLRFARKLVNAVRYARRYN
jgi:hypothetical protein